MNEYNSKFTGTEIDAALSRAAAGGAIDTDLALKAPLASPALTGTPTINGVPAATLGSPAFTGTPTINGVPAANVGQLCNPNLLDNWYFGNPVNQRGQTSYTGAGYTIDRWESYSNLAVIIEPDGITIRNDTDDTGYFGQIAEYDLWDALVGKTVTMSVLNGNGTLYFCTGTYGTNISFPVGDGVNAYMWPTSKEHFDFSIAAGVSIKVSAVKLELGSQQTLAHQDENGNWVLNEIPNYAETMAKCQRYQLVLDVKNYGSPYACFGTGFHITGGTSRSVITVPLPATLRSKPSISYTGNIMILYGNTEVAVTNLFVDTVSSNSLQLIAECSGPAAGDATALWIRNDAMAKIILDANL